MCGRYAVTLPPEAMRRVFGYAEQPNFPPRYNVAPTQPVPVVRRGGEPGSRQFVLMRWGFVPGWAKEIGSKPLINARSETVAAKPTFRGAFRHRRCLVPADGYYEWWRGGKGTPQPYYIHPRDGGPLAMAGIWETWMSPDGSELDSVAILTMAASGPVAAIHSRMPCVLAAPLWDAWMDTAGTDRAGALAMLTAPADDFYDIRKVSTAVNRVANEGPGLQRPLDGQDDGPATGEAAPRLI